ncbi:hypothetical protein ACROYT_G014446 [Oculina patagonica]
MSHFRLNNLQRQKSLKFAETESSSTAASYFATTCTSYNRPAVFFGNPVAWSSPQYSGDDLLRHAFSAPLLTSTPVSKSNQSKATETATETAVKLSIVYPSKPVNKTLTREYEALGKGFSSWPAFAYCNRRDEVCPAYRSRPAFAYCNRRDEVCPTYQSYMDGVIEGYIKDVLIKTVRATEGEEVLEFCYQDYTLTKCLWGESITYSVPAVTSFIKQFTPARFLLFQRR